MLKITHEVPAGPLCLLKPQKDGHDDMSTLRMMGGELNLGKTGVGSKESVNVKWRNKE